MGRHSSWLRKPQNPFLPGRVSANVLSSQVAFALVPMPVYFYLRGGKIRERSNFAPTFPMATQAAHSSGDSEDAGNEKME